MKNFIVVAGMLAVALSPAMAVNQKNVGAGLGTMIFKDQDGLLSEVCAATTNGLYGTQTFAITSGTLGAEKPSSLVGNEKASEFIAANMDQLACDIAMGEGESVNALAELLNVKDTQTFAANLHTHFDEIYTSESVTSAEVVQRIAKVM